MAREAADRAAESAALCEVPLGRPGRHPLYYVHEVSGSVLHFAPVARRLDPCRSVIGLQSVGLHPGQPADRTIEEMADRFLAIIDRRAGSDPLDILGYSMGGLVAFEMAARAAAEGRVVRLLGLIDAPPPGSPSGMNTERVVRMMARNFGVELALPEPSRDPEELLALLVAAARDAGRLPPDYAVADLRPAVELQLTNGRAAEAYRPARVFPYDVCLIGAGPGVLAGKAAGWAPHVSGRIDGEEVAAGHYELMTGRAAAQVAAALERWIIASGA